MKLGNDFFNLIMWLFLKCFVVCKLYTDLLPNLPLWCFDISTWQLASWLTFLVRSYKPESISKKSHLITFMKSSFYPIYQRVSLMLVSNWYHVMTTWFSENFLKGNTDKCHLIPLLRFRLISRYSILK